MKIKKNRKVIRLTESEMVSLVERVVKRVNKKPIIESRNKRRFIKEDFNDLLRRLKSMFPNLEAFNKGDIVCVVLSHQREGGESNTVYKNGITIKDEGSDVYGIGDYNEVFVDGVPVEIDMDINAEDSFDGIVGDIRRKTSIGGKPYEAY